MALPDVARTTIAERARQSAEPLRQAFRGLLEQLLRDVDQDLVTQATALKVVLADANRVILRQYALWLVADTLAVRSLNITVPPSWTADQTLDALCDEVAGDAEVLETLTARLTHQAFGRSIEPSVHDWLEQEIVAVMHHARLADTDYADVHRALLEQHRRLYVGLCVHVGELTLFPQQVRKLPLGALRHGPGKGPQPPHPHRPPPQPHA